jgi:hypothetical protein
VRRFLALLPPAIALAVLAGHAGSAAPEKKLRADIDGARIDLIVQDCKVYLTAHSTEKFRGRVRVLEPEPYPWLTFCERQEISTDQRYITVTLGRIAFGAGGCCATGGTYRSRDGRTWEKRVGVDQWRPVEQDGAGKAPAAPAK